MQFFLDVIKFISDHGMQVFEAVVAIFLAFIVFLKAIIAVALIIPGEQPEKALQGVVDFFQKGINFLAKFSRKPNP